MGGRYQVIALLLLILTLIFGTYGYGLTQYKRGQRAILEEIEIARAKSAAEKAAIDEQIGALTDDELRDRALKWVRPVR